MMSLSDASSLEVDWTLRPLLQGSGRTAATTSLKKKPLNTVSSLQNTLRSGSRSAYGCCKNHAKSEKMKMLAEQGAGKPTPKEKGGRV
jgi:hypothetical protein